MDFIHRPQIDVSPSRQCVKFFYALDVDPGDARVIVRLGDQTPLLLEKRIGEGRVVLLTSGLDNLTNDFPLHPAFVPFIDGSVLNNRPFQEAISAIRGRPAYREIDRRLVYVDPHPLSPVSHRGARMPPCINWCTTWATISAPTLSSANRRL